MEIDPLLPVIVGITLIVFFMGYALRIMKQPYVVAYILTGIIIGPHALNLVKNGTVVQNLGSIGVMLLLFFVGMHISIPRLFKKWKVAIVGTLIQITITVLVMILLGAWLRWPLSLQILLGFVISLSSTAVVMKILEDWGEINTRVGQNVLGILLVQDVLIIPMIVIMEFFGKKSLESGEIFLTLIGGVLFLQLLVWLLRRDNVKLPFEGHLPDDKESQVMIALVLCFGLAVVAMLFGLSAALGAFIAGVVVSTAKQTRWVRNNLEPFRIVFVAVFFIYVGLLIDLSFVLSNIIFIFGLVLLILILNTGMNAAILHFLGDKLPGSVYGGALLSEIGEFSFLIGMVGWEAGIIPYEGYQIVISLIALTLLVSPLWIMLFKKLVGVHGGHVPT